MPVPSFADAIAYFRRKYWRLSKWPYYVAAAVIVIGGRWLNALLTSPETDAAIQQALVNLGQINPLSMIGYFFDSLLGCDMTQFYDGMHENCSAWRFVDPRRVLGALLVMFYNSWMSGGWTERLVLMSAIVFAIPVSIGLVTEAARRLTGGRGDTDFFKLLAIAALIPFVASFTGLVLQGVAWAFVFVLGMMVGLIGFFIAQFAVIIEYLRMLRDVGDNARELEELHGKLRQSENAAAGPPEAPT